MWPRASEVFLFYAYELNPVIIVFAGKNYTCGFSSLEEIKDSITQTK
jgi:hypothetical protein